MSVEEEDFFQERLGLISESSGIYLGIGCVGKDGQPGEFAFSLAPFLYFAEQMRIQTGVSKGRVLVMDMPNGRLVDVSHKRRVLKVLLGVLGIHSWDVVLYSELFGGWPEGQPYEEVQTLITGRLLEGGGYQVGWVYPSVQPGQCDERHFARYFLDKTGRADVGFLFGRFPELIPNGIAGSPYLVRPVHAHQRLELFESEASCRAKFTQGRKLGKVRPPNAYPVLRVLERAGALDQIRKGELTEQLIQGIARLSETLQQNL